MAKYGMPRNSHIEYISYVRTPISRLERVRKAEHNIYSMVPGEQKDFIEFVLNSYIKDGVDELDDNKLRELITLKYKSIVDAEKILGNLENVRNIFIDFQKHLYQTASA